MATNLAGLPIFEEYIQGTQSVRLVRNPTGTVTNQVGNEVELDDKGEPVETGTYNRITQPPMAIRLQVLVTEVVRLSVTGAARTPTTITRPIIFARTPARMNRDIINYESKIGSTLYRNATAPLFQSTEKYNLSSELLNSFLDAVSRRARSCGFGIMTIPNGPPPHGINKNIVTQHGELSINMIREYITDLIMVAGGNRESQEDEQLFTCLMDSITKEAISTVSLKEEEYSVNNELPGVLLLKVIICEAQIDIKSTANLLMEKLSSGMPNIMAECGNNVKLFNEQIKSIRKKLVARGEGPTNLVPQLLRTFGECDGAEGPFSRYIEQLENAYTYGRTVLNTEILMQSAETKYLELVEKNKYKVGSKKSEGILALQTEIIALKTMTSEQYRE